MDRNASMRVDDFKGDIVGAFLDTARPPPETASTIIKFRVPGQFHRLVAELIPVQIFGYQPIVVLMAVQCHRLGL